MKVLQSGGIAAITMAAVCGEARLNARYFYESFANREAFLDALFAHLVSNVLDTLQEMVAEDDSRKDSSRVRALFDAGLEILTDNPVLFEQVARSEPGEMGMRLRAAFIRAFAERIDWFQIGPRDPDPVRARVAALLFAGGVAELATAVFDGTLQVTIDEAFDHAVVLLGAYGEAAS